jgi:hypothetical protein
MGKGENLLKVSVNDAMTQNSGFNEKNPVGNFICLLMAAAHFFRIYNKFLKAVLQI